MVKDIDVQGALKIKEVGIKATFFFLAPRNFEIIMPRILAERSNDNLDFRIKNYKGEIRFRDNFNFYIDTSGDSDDTNIIGCVKKVRSLMASIPTS